MKKVLSSIAVFFMCMATLFVCSCKKTGENEVIIPSATATPVTTDNSSLPTGGELVLPIPENAIKNNPYSVTTEEVLTMYSLVYEPLIETDDSGKLNPSLAQSWTRDEENSSLWILNLRTNVVWHDGSAFTADDVLYSLRFLREYLQTENASTYYLNCSESIELMEKRDDTTIAVTFTKSGYNSLYSLCFPIVSDGRTGGGTGAYKVKTVTNQSVLLEINTKWWKDFPHIQSIRFEERLNNETALASYAAGQLNFVPTSNLSAGKYRKDSTTDVLDIMTQNAELLIFNYNNSLLLDMNVRRAIAHCLDRGKIISNVYMNRAQTCDVPIAPDSWLYSAQSTAIDHNVEKSNTLLENAGYRDSDGDGIREKDGNPANKLSFKILVSESTDNTLRKNAAEQMANQLLGCGIEIVTETKNFTLGDANSPYLEALKNGEFDLALTGVNIARSCDLTEFFNTDGSLNFGGISNDELSTLANQINISADETSMRESAYAFQSAFVEKLPFLVLYFRLNSIVYTDRLKGIASIREPNIMYSVSTWYMN